MTETRAELSAYIKSHAVIPGEPDVLCADAGNIIHMLDNCEITLNDANSFFVSVDTDYLNAAVISQRAAEAIYTPEGKRQIQETIGYYMENARIMRDHLTKLGIKVYGGVNAPYLWVKTPDNTPSWKFFENMLYGAGVVCTPGVGFGPSGEGYVRLTSFGNREDVIEAMRRLSAWMCG